MNFKIQILVESYGSFLTLSEVANPENIKKKCIKMIADYFSKVNQNESPFLPSMSFVDVDVVSRVNTFRDFRC